MCEHCKCALRDKLQRDTQRFLSRGGIIHRIPTGKSGIKLPPAKPYAPDWLSNPDGRLTFLTRGSA